MRLDDIMETQEAVFKSFIAWLRKDWGYPEGEGDDEFNRGWTACQLSIEQAFECWKEDQQ